MIRAVEGPIATVRGARPDDVVYDGAARALAPVWIELRAAMRDVLEETTLADLVARSPSTDQRRAGCRRYANVVWRVGLT